LQNVSQTAKYFSIYFAFIFQRPHNQHLADTPTAPPFRSFYATIIQPPRRPTFYPPPFALTLRPIT